MTGRQVLIGVVVFIVLVGLITLALFLFDNESRVSFNEGVSISLPDDWEHNVQPSVQEGLTSFWRDLDGTYVSVAVFYNPGDTQLNVNQIRDRNPGYTRVETLRGGGIEYSGSQEAGDVFESAGDDFGREISDNYIVGRSYTYDEGRLVAECRVVGESAGDYESACNKIVKSLKLE